MGNMNHCQKLIFCRYDEERFERRFGVMQLFVLAEVEVNRRLRYEG